MKKFLSNSRKKSKKGFLALILIVTLIVLVGLGAYFAFYKPGILGTSSKISLPHNEIKQKVEAKAPLSASINLSVPFVCQAPFANWNVHEDSCEEAAILMDHVYLEGESLTLEYADKEFLVMRQWQKDHYGAEKDMTCAEGAKFANDYYGYKNSKSFNNITVNDIKSQLAAKNLVIVPVMTHSLLNLHYGAKSVYHYVLIKGYNQDGVVTNDAGIKEGENYFYSWDTIFSAIDAQTPVMNQGRSMLIIKK
jgi:hypothetical protein